MDERGKPGWRKVGEELARLRKRARMLQSEVAPHVSVVPAHISAWERGKRGMTQEQAELLDRALNGNGRLVRVWRSANAPEKIPDWYDKVPELEARVVELREYQCLIFPGLVQTPEYATATIRDAGPWKSPAEVKRMVESRMERQAILNKEHPPLVSIVMEGCVLRRIVGGEKIQQGQLDSVLRLVEDGKIRLQVTAPHVLRHPGTAGPFRIYTFPDSPSMASAEFSGGEFLMDDLERVQQRAILFGHLQADALSLETSVDLIRKVRKGTDE